jgi:AmiR/NasT family two-component response regulator
MRVKVFVSSPSQITLALIKTMLLGLEVTLLDSMEQVTDAIRLAASDKKTIDFIIMDSQSETAVDEVAQLLSESEHFFDCKIIHLYTPTPTSLSKDPNWGGNSSVVVKSHKPPRTLRLLHLLASIKGIPSDKEFSRQLDPSQVEAELSAAKRTLYGNVLIAEGKRQRLR